MIKSLCCVMLCAISLGCASMNIKNPMAAVTGMQVKSVDASGFTMNFAVDVSNPNTVALPLTVADYKLGLSGVNLVQGKAKPEGSIPAGGTKNITLPVTLTFESLLAAEQAIIKGGGNVPYALDGGLSLKTPMLGSVRVPLQYKGTLSVRDILSQSKAVMQNPAAQKLAKELITGFFK